jgi:hypothetical protein
MKVSAWLRQWQLTGEVPDLKESERPNEMAFWAGWLTGGQTKTAVSMDDRRAMAIKAAEFIEEQK